MATLIMASNLKRIRGILRKYKWICDSSLLPGEYQVIALYCYIADATFLKSLTPPVVYYFKTAIFLHDIVITDGQNKLKCFLALPLSDLVQKNILKVGDFIEINKGKLCYLEGEYGDQHIVTYVVLEDIKILEKSRVVFPDISALSFLESNNGREHDLIPLVTGRKHYVPVWTPSVPHQSSWKDVSDYTFQDGIDPPPVYIQKLADFGTNYRALPRPYPPILLRVVFRSKMHNFGHNLADHSNPFVAFLTVADSSVYCTLTCFGQSHYGLYYYSVPGTILLIEGYSLQEPFRDNDDLWHSHAGTLSRLNNSPVELKLTDPSVVKIIPDDSVAFSQQISLLPIVEYVFVNRASLEFVADNVKVDIIGLITFVSAYVRYRYKEMNFALSFWIEAIDTSSHLPFRLVATIDPYKCNYEAILPGQILVATQVSVVRVDETIIRDKQAALYLKATTKSEFYVDHRNKPYNRQQAAVDIGNIILDYRDEVSIIREHILRIGGFYSFPPDPKSLELFKLKDKRKLLPGAQWGNMLYSLKYRETCIRNLGCFIVQVEYVDFQTVDAREPTYGWSYRNGIVSRQTLFLDIRVANKLRDLQLLNSEQCDKFAFPQQYSAEFKEELKTYREFPPVEAEHWKPPVENAVQSVPFNVDGYYSITVASLHYQNLVQCILIPEPSAAPHPTFLELLSGQYESLPMRRVTSFIGEPPRYTWNEVKRVQRTAAEVAGKTFIFGTRAYVPKPDIYQLFVRRAFLCPPDQISYLLQEDLGP